jgi:hypothetical protein
MPVVTQLSPNFLGGVSKQNDDKKLAGQVSECINGYPDPTYGLLKRPGMKFIDHLKDTDDNAYDKAALEDAVWFFLDRSQTTSYVAAIKGSNIYAWNAETGKACNVTNNGGSYLTNANTSDDFHFRSIQDTTIITNKTKVTAMLPAGTFFANSVGTLKLVSLVDGYNYTVTFPAAAANNTDDVVAEVAAQTNTTFNDMLLYDASNVNTNHHLIDAIKDTIEAEHTAGNTNFDGIWYLEGYNNSIVIKRGTGTNTVKTDYSAVTGTPLAFSIDARGGFNNESLEAFLDQVNDVTELPAESFDGHNVRILNTNSDSDDYYVKYVAYDGIRGKGYWLETIARDGSPGLDASTMPHRFVFNNTVNGVDHFTFEPIPFVSRLVGDDITSPAPSFIGKTIKATFFYNNRFGLLSEDNVILSVANEPFNFFVKSALTQIASDPIDLNVSSTRPVTLFDVLPTAQGLLLFGDRQQFILSATDANTLTPTSSIIRTVSNYEMDSNISPVDIGTTVGFVNKVPDYAKVFSMQLRDVEQPPIVVDISKVVLEWIPETVDRLVSSPQNSFIILIDRQSSYIYMYSYYNDGEKDLFQAWTKWELTGTIQDAYVLNDDIVVVTQQEDAYLLNSITVNELPTGDVSVVLDSNNEFVVTGNPCLDLFSLPKSPDGIIDKVVYIPTDNVTKIYTPYKPIKNKKGALLIGKPDKDAGFFVEVTPKIEANTNYNYFEAVGNLSDAADSIIIGYNYHFEVQLPTFYFRRRDGNSVDFSAILTIARIKVSTGRSGPLVFETKLGSSKQWTLIKEVTLSDDYAFSTSPVKPEYKFNVPIHQRNTNFELKMTSDYPYPVSLVEMMWEGNYSPRYYRRA